jgi:xanthine dehydrogenase YagT iron-sulfur-binding subunit
MGGVAACGARPSPLRLYDQKGNCCSLADVAGRPVIIACTAGVIADLESRDGLGAVRAELRGLGAALLIVGPNEVWLIQPDDPPQRMGTTPTGSDEFAAETVRLTLGLPADGTTAPLTIVMLDEAGGGAWRWSAPNTSDHGRAADVEDLSVALRRAADRRADEALSIVDHPITRRAMLTSTLAVALFAALAETPPAAAVQPAAVTRPVSAGTVPVGLTVNGTVHNLHIEPRVTLLDALRERIGLTGTKKGCDHGQCGACTVLVDGRRILSCLTLAVMHQGVSITTIEGLARGSALHPMQAAFLEEDAFQCGYCTPGQILSAVGLLAEGRARSADDVREQMSGNLCRCGAYPNIVAAIERVRKT